MTARLIDAVAHLAAAQEALTSLEAPNRHTRASTALDVIRHIEAYVEEHPRAIHGDLVALEKSIADTFGVQL